MDLEFSKGIVRISSTETREAAWARTSFGTLALLEGETSPRIIDPSRTVERESITSFALPEVDRPTVECVVGAILMGGYLNKPGVKGKGEAVLYLLVNEAIHKMREIAKLEGLEVDATVTTDSSGDA